MTLVRIWGLLVAAMMMMAVTDPAAAQQRHERDSQAANRSRCVLMNNGRERCAGPVQMASRTQAVTDSNGSIVAQASSDTTIIGGRPAGCPHRYCGCGLRMYLGLDDTRLNLASNWMRLFPRVAGPAAGVVAVRSGHVMYIEGAAGDGQWMVRDYNSGGGLSRLHVRSVRGFVFVNPRATVASR